MIGLQKGQDMKRQGGVSKSWHVVSRALAWPEEDTEVLGRLEHTSEGLGERELGQECMSGRNPRLTCDSEAHCITPLGPQAIVSCAVVVSRMLCSQRDAERTFFPESLYLLQKNIFPIKLVYNWERTFQIFAVKCHCVSLKNQVPSSSESQLRLRHWH